MGNSDNRCDPDRKLLSERRTCFLSLPATWGVISLLFVLGHAQGVAEQTNHSGPVKFQSALQSQMQPASELAKLDATTDSPDYSIRIMTALALCAAFALPLVVPRVARLVNQPAKTPAVAGASAPAAF